MTSKTKLLKKFLKTPSSLKFNEIETILLDFGFIKKQGKGSHQKFKHPFLQEQLIIPIHNNECRDVYKKHASKVIKNNLL